MDMEDSGFGILKAIFVVLLLVKIFGADISWWIVFSPILLGVGFFIAIAIWAIIIGKK